MSKTRFSKKTLTGKIPVGISECLLGNPVRFNGGHKRSQYCEDTLKDYFDFRPVCPEMAIGLGAPREVIRLVGDPKQPRAIQMSDSPVDLTDQLAAQATQVVKNMPDLCGFIVTEKSPSCGAFRVKCYDDNGIPSGVPAAGIFTQRLKTLWPELPIEESGRLNDPHLRENFLLRVFALHDWNQTVLNDPSAHDVLQFYSRYKYLVMAHSHSHYKMIGQLLANAGNIEPETLTSAFLQMFMQALSKPSSRQNHVNVLYHLKGYLKQKLDGTEKSAIDNTIEQYRIGYVPLIAPLTIMKHCFQRFPSEYINQQTYLEPYPQALGLHNQK